MLSCLAPVQSKSCKAVGTRLTHLEIGLAGVLCEIVNKNGSMARKAELQRFAREHDLSIITIADLVRYRIFHEQKS